jgi:hypothetical protein
MKLTNSIKPLYLRAASVDYVRDPTGRANCLVPRPVGCQQVTCLRVRTN